MNAARATSLLETLSMGIDPITGETLDAEHVCAQPETLRALHLAVAALRKRDSRSSAGRNGPLCRRGEAACSLTRPGLHDKIFPQFF